MKPTYVQRLRIIFRKFGPTRFIGHLDVARTWERALNRAHIPMAYSQGFNQRPLMQVAAPLPLGYTSDCEIIDIWVKELLEPSELGAQIMQTMAPGIEIVSVEAVRIKQPSLQTLTREASYYVRLPFETLSSAELQQKATELLAQPEIIRQRRGKKYKGKTYDLRPLIIALAVQPDSAEPSMTMQLHLATGKSGRPDEVLASMGFDALDARIHRTAIVLAPDEGA